jgi:hypothetical protein
MTQTEYARHKNVELAAVKRAITEGRLPKHCIKIGSNSRKLILVEEADKFWEENTIINNKNELRQKSLPLKGEPKQARPVSDDSDDPEAADPDAPTLNKFRTVREGYNAKMAQLQYEEKVGKLVNVDDVRKAATEIGTNIRNALENFADKLAPIMAAETNIDKCHKIINDEIRAVLTNLSRGDYDFLKRKDS